MLNDLFPSVRHDVSAGEDVPGSVANCTPHQAPHIASNGDSSLYGLGFCVPCYEVHGRVSGAVSASVSVCSAHAKDRTWCPPALSKPQDVSGRSGRRRERRRRWAELTGVGQAICRTQAARPQNWEIPPEAHERLKALSQQGLRVVSRASEIRARFARDAVELTERWYRSRWWRTRAVVQALVNVIDWDSGVVQATGRRIAEVATNVLAQWVEEGLEISGRGCAADLAQQKLSERSAYDAIAWLEETQILTCLLRGASAEALDTEVGRAGIYVITAPTTTAKQKPLPQNAAASSPSSLFDPTNGISRSPFGFSSADSEAFGGRSGFSSEWAQDSVVGHSFEHIQDAPTAQQRHKRARDLVWDRRVPVSESAERAIGRLMRSTTQWSVKTGRIVSVCRMWWRSGWCSAAIMHAIDYRPDGTKHFPIKSEDVRSWPGLMAHRLRLWLDDDGQPLPPPVTAVPAGYRAGDHRRRNERAQVKQQTDLSTVPPQSSHEETHDGGLSDHARTQAAWIRDTLQRVNQRKR